MKQAFTQELNNSFKSIGEEQELDIDSFNQALNEAGEKVLHIKRGRKRNGCREKLGKHNRKEINQTKN